jgi:hypothetical protein
MRAPSDSVIESSASILAKEWFLCNCKLFERVPVICVAYSQGYGEVTSDVNHRKKKIKIPGFERKTPIAHAAK